MPGTHAFAILEDGTSIPRAVSFRPRDVHLAFSCSQYTSPTSASAWRYDEHFPLYSGWFRTAAPSSGNCQYYAVTGVRAERDAGWIQLRFENGQDDQGGQCCNACGSLQGGLGCGNREEMKTLVGGIFTSSREASQWKFLAV